MLKRNSITRNNIKNHVYDIIKETIVIDRNIIKDDKIFLYDSEMDMDSLDYLNIIMKCEKVFNINITDEEIEHTSTVGELITLIENKHPKNISFIETPTRVQKFLQKFKNTRSTISNKTKKLHTK